MRVVHVTPYYAPESEFGGPPATIHELCRALSASGIDVHVVTTAAAESEEQVDGVAVTRVARRTRLGFGAAIDSALDTQLAHADVCHVHTLFNWPAWRGAARAGLARVPIVVSPRGMLEPAALDHHGLRKRLSWQLMDRAVLRRAKVVIASSALESATLEARGIRSVLLPNGVELPPRDGERGQFRSAHGIPAGAPVVTFLGRLHPIKRLDLVAAAFLALAARRPDARLVIAGPDESGLWAATKETLRAIEARVHRVGSFDAAEKWRILADSDVLVLCSDSESYGRVAAEALAAGVPVVISKTCPWDVVEREGIGRWVPQSANEIAAALDGVLADAAEHQAMRERARRYARAHLAWDGLVERYRALYELVVSGFRQPAAAMQARS